MRATTPLLHGALEPYPRPWEPKFPDAIENPRHLDKERLSQTLRHPIDTPPQHLDYYFPPRFGSGQQTMIFDSIPINYQDDGVFLQAPPDGYSAESYEDTELPADFRDTATNH
jgi:hypothetical protein